MRTLRTVAEVREALAPLRRNGARIALVPTMGALHDGHLSLLRAAREECDVVVMSLFVNPSQFGPGEDLASYPRDEQADALAAERAGVDILFAPSVEEIYPPGFATTVTVHGITEGLEGAHRGPAHFAGVATVVAKLLNIVVPDVAYFGQKDAQQVLVIKRLVEDLAIASEIFVCPTVREPDGLALSSRNAYLTTAERAQATALSRALADAATLVAAGEPDSAVAAAAAQRQLVAEGIDAEYLAIVDPDSLAPVERIEGTVLVAVAAQIGRARLIDNVLAAPVLATTESR